MWVQSALSPFGGTIAHGFLTLSLLVHLTESLSPVEQGAVGTIINYGFDRIRFTQPVRSGSRIRAVCKLVAIEEKRPGQTKLTHDITVENEGCDQPALIATWMTQRLA